MDSSGVRLYPSRQILMRIASLFSVLLALSLLAVVGLWKVEQQGLQEIVGEEMEEHGRLLDGVLALAGEPLRLLVEGYGRRRMFTRPNENESPARAESTLDAGLHIYGLDSAWVLEADGKLRLQVAAESLKGMPLPVTGADLVRFEPKGVHFFMLYQDEVYEVRGRRMNAPRGTDARLAGWIFAADRLDGERLTPPHLPVEGRVSLLPVSAAADLPDKKFPVRIDRPLLDFNGRALRILRVDYLPDEMAIASRAGFHARLLILGFMAFSIGFLALCVWYWVIRPVAMMQASLETQEVNALTPLFDEGGDLGRLAGFVRHSLENREFLRSTLEERARLGRDLHDGVIQMVYRAGLDLARARGHLRTDPAKADHILLEVRSTLDQAVNELRGAIHRLGSEAVNQESLQIALPKLPVISHLEKNVRVDIKVDDEVEAMFGGPHRINLLYFANEAFSNALRHGHATVIELRLTTAGERGVLLSVNDNGVGFDPSAPGNPIGLGLSNLTQRAAQLGGTLKVDSSPGGGTRLTLLFQPS